MRRLLALVVSTALLAVPLPAAGAGDTTWRLPGVGTVGASVESTAGKLRLRVTAGSTEAVSVADLGLITTAGDLSKDLDLRAQSHRTVRAAYRMTTGKQ